MQLWVSHVIVTYANNTSRMYPHSLVWLIMSKEIVEKESSSISLVKNQMLTLLSSKFKELSSSKSNPIPFKR